MPEEKISREEVAHLAHLARLEVTDEEIDTFAGQLESILENVAKIAEVSVGDVPQTGHNVSMVNVTRPDVVRPSLDRDEVLSQAPAAELDRFRVPRILDEE